MKWEACFTDSSLKYETDKDEEGTKKKQQADWKKLK
jgi:hypothetical protein